MHAVPVPQRCGAIRRQLEQSARTSLVTIAALVAFFVIPAQAQTQQWSWKFVRIEQEFGSENHFLPALSGPATVFPTKEAALVAMRASIPNVTHVLTQEQGVASMTASRVQYRVRAPRVPPNISAWSYLAPAGEPNALSTEAEADAYIYEQYADITCLNGDHAHIEVLQDWTPAHTPNSFGVTREIKFFHVFADCIFDEYPYYSRYRTIDCPTGYIDAPDPDNLCMSAHAGIVEGPSMECPTGDVPSSLHGNPCDVVTGEKFESETDYSSSQLSFVRSYHSMAALGTAQPGKGTTFGRGWTHNFAGHLVFANPERTVPSALVRANGFQEYLSEDASGAYVSMSASEIRLSVHAGGWVATTRDGRREFYDATGNLTGLATASGPVASLAYQGGRLSSITSPHGHTLLLEYEEDRLARLRDPDNRVITYRYDVAGRLTDVGYPDSTTRIYHYENSAFPNHLTGITSDDGIRYSTYAYDSLGRALSSEHAGGAQRITLAYTPTTTTVTDSALGTTIYTLSLEGSGPRRIVGIDRDGLTESFVREAGMGRVTEATDARGIVTQRAYDLFNSLTKTEAFGTPHARTTSTQFHPTFRSPTQVDEPGRRTTFTYDANGNVETKTVLDTTTSESRTWTYTYNSFGQVLTEDGPRTDVTDVTTYTYHNCTAGFQCGQIHTITNALSHVTTFNSYNAHGRPLTITDPNGIVTTLTYDLRRRLTSRTVGTEQTTFEYWPSGLLKSVTLPDLSFLQYTYDDAHRLAEVADADGNRIVYTLDAMGNRTAEQLYDPSNALTQTRTRVFNTLNQLWKEIGAAGTPDVTTAYGYDNNGNQTDINAPLGRNTMQMYDELNRLTQITDPANSLVQHGYDAAGNLVSVIDPRNLQTSYEYNGYGDVTREVSPDAGVTVTTYDAAGNIATTTDARNKVATYSYDAIARVVQIAYNDQTISYTYDVGANALGHLSSLADASGSTSWTYTPNGRVASKTQTTGGVIRTVSYGYNNAGQLTSQTMPSGQLIGYEYANGRLSSIRLNGATVVSDMLYVPFGPTRGWRWGNGTYMVREYDQDGQLTDNNSGGFESYTYYPDGRIQTVTLEGPDGIGAPGAIALSPASTSNRLVSTTGILNRNYTYDAAGHVIGDGTHTFTYNDAGRMVTANGAGGQTVYTYNALGQRVRKSNASETVYFVYDEAGHVLGEYGAAGELIQEIIWFDDIPVASIRLVGSGPATGAFYIHTDHLNAPTKLTSSSTNAVVWRWDHDPYGNGAPNEDPDGNGLALRFNLRFPGQYFDAETGLHQNYYRDYDPQVGRYVQSDPAGLLAGINTYAYVGGNPISFSDPRGLNPYAGARAAWWVGTRIGGAINYGIQAATGATLGSLLYDACHDSEEERCRKILKGCREKCLDTFVNDPDSLPGMGSDLQGRQRRCIRECMEDQNCFDF